MTKLHFEIVPAGGDEALGCLRRYFAELSERFEDGFDRDGAAPDPSDYAAPDGTFLVGRARGDAVVGGEFRRLDGETAYIKRMWVDPAMRGHGFGSQLLAALERTAARLGYPSVALETNRALSEAVGLYRRSGYEEVPAFNDEKYAHHWFRNRPPAA